MIKEHRLLRLSGLLSSAICAIVLALPVFSQSEQAQQPATVRDVKVKADALGNTPSWKQFHDQALQAFDRNDFDEASNLWTKAIWEAEHATPACIEPGVVNCLVGLAIMNDRQGKFGESERLYELAMRDMEGFAGRGSPRFADFMADLADLYHRHSRADQAEVTFKDLLTFREAKARETDNLKSSAERSESYQKLAESLDSYSRFLRRQARNHEATAVENRAQTIRTSVQPDASGDSK